MSKADPSRKRFEQPMRVLTGAFPTDKALFAGANQLQAWSAYRRSNDSSVNSFTRRRRDAVAV